LSLDTGRRMLNAELSPIQGKIKLLLVMKGLRPNQIEFSGEDGVLRYHYWKTIPDDHLEYATEHSGATFKEREWFEEDCGWLVCYEIIQ